ncbi:MAG: SDR family NAD(P)-dependent oxidoreductase [Gammaproteobacteria bacterium]
MSISPRIKIIVHDLAAVAIAWTAAWLARFNLSVPPEPYLGAAIEALPAVMLVQAAMAWQFGLYRGLWRFASLPDLWNILRAAGLGALLVALALFLLNRLEGIPRSVLVLYPLLLVFTLGGPRLGYRVWKDHSLNLRTLPGAKRVVIVGGGHGGEMVLRDMLREGSHIPVGIADDDPRLQRSNIHGVPVLGTIDTLPDIVRRREVDMLVIAIPSASGAQMRRIVESCEKTGKTFRTLPQLNDMLSGRGGLDALRAVSLDDLLGRDKIELDWQPVQAAIAGRTVLVSGGGGSIGSELCRQVAGLGVERLVVLDNSEHNLYQIERELAESWPRLEAHCVLGDVQDAAAVEAVFTRFSPALVFHAAAYKHVPILQQQVREAVRVNVLGTAEMLEAAERHGCDGFVLISTDKAVRPSSVMGASKRFAELVCTAREGRAGMRVITVRFGNVLGSAGSVVPLFRRQIRDGGPVTVTHPDAQRYFMTIGEACQLILQAGAVGTGGEIFVLDMGEPVNITYLAEQLIRLSGREPGVDVGIVYTGLRPGEKLSEQLFRDDEALRPTPHGKLLLAQHAPVDPSAVAVTLEGLGEAVRACDEGAARRLLLGAVPEFGRDNTAVEQGDNVVSIQSRSAS